MLVTTGMNNTVERKVMIEKLVGDALDKAVPYTWTKLDYDQVKHVERTVAKLVIQECIEIARANNNSGEGGVIAQAIEEHFGVK